MDTDCIQPILPLLSALLVESRFADLALSISVFYTRAVTKRHPFEDLVLPTGLSLTPGRPDVYSILVGATAQTGSRRGVFVGVCGPASLGDTVREAVSAVDDQGLSHRAGGLELHEE